MAEASSSASTPSTHECQSCVAIRNALAANPLYNYGKKVTFWTDPIESGLVFAIITLFFYLITIGGYTVVTLLSYILLAFLLASVAYVQGLALYFTYVKKSEAPKESPLVAKFKSVLKLSITREDLEPHVVLIELVANEFLNSLVKALSVTDVAYSLQFAFGLWVATYVGTWSLASLAYLAILVAFIWPRLYAEKKSTIDNIAIKVKQQMAHHSKNIYAKLPPNLKAKLPASIKSKFE